MSDAELPVPGTIGPFRVVRPLARGGMAAVYEVEDPATGERYALKLLTRAGLARPRFSREYRALIRVDHPNIVRVYRYGLTDDGEPYLTMELLDGVPAQVHAKAAGRPGTPRRTAEVVRVVTAVADALGYLHDRGIVHRDLKSSNVMVLRDGRVKLLDFGTARIVDAAEEITRHGEFIGTFAYASPEQLTGGEVDARSDIYSLAVLFYRLLTGRRPFEGRNPHEIARRHLEHIPPPPGDLVAGIPSWVDALVMAMLAKSPADRPQSAHEVAHVLRSRTHARRAGGYGWSALALEEPQVVGRDREVRAIRAALTGARPGRALLVTGPMGSGRGRLLSQAARDATSLGWRVYDAAFVRRAGLGALEEVLRAAARGLEPPEGAVVDPDLAALAAPPDAPAGRPRVVDAAVSLISRRARAEDRPVLLVLRDVHLASALALRALSAVRRAAQAESLRVLLLMSALDEEDRPGARLRQTFPDARRIELGPLGPEEVGRLVGSILGRRPPPPALARRIHEAAGGYPGTVVEVVYAMVREGLIEPRRTDDDRVEWLDRSGGRVAVPAPVREVLAARIERLPRTASRVLEALAVAGGEAGAAALAHGCELPEEEVRRALAELARERLVEERAPGVWAFRLGLAAQIVREGVRLGRRHLLRRRFAEALRDAPPTARKVRLLLEAGDAARAVADAVAWTDEAAARPDEVVALLERVVERAVRAGDVPPADLARLRLRLAVALGRISPGDARIGELLDGAERAGDEALEAAARIERAAWRVRRGRPDAALPLLHGLDGDPRAAVLRARALLLSGRHAEAGDAADEARSLARARHRPELAAGARVVRGLVHLAAGRLRDAEAELAGAAEEYGRAGAEPPRWHALLHLAAVRRLQGRMSEARRALEPLVPAARATGDPYLLAGLLLELAETAVELSRLGEARELLAELDALDVAWSDPLVAAAAAVARARLRLAAEDPDAAARALAPAVRALERASLPVRSGQVLAWWGLALHRAGERVEGRIHLAHAIDRLSEVDHLPALAEACGLRWRCLGPDADPDEVFAPVRAWLERGEARLARVEWLVAGAEFASHRGDVRRAWALCRDAADEMSAIREQLDPDDAAALRVHPWQVRIQRLLLG